MPPTFTVIDFGSIPLSASALNDEAGEDETLFMVLHPYNNMNVKVLQSKFPNPVEHWAIWMVARTDIDATYDGPAPTPQKPEKKKSKAAMLLNGMSEDESDNVSL